MCLSTQKCRGMGASPPQFVLFLGLSNFTSGAFRQLKCTAMHLSGANWHVVSSLILEKAYFDISIQSADIVPFNTLPFNTL